MKRRPLLGEVFKDEQAYLKVKAKVGEFVTKEVISWRQKARVRWAERIISGLWKE